MIQIFPMYLGVLDRGRVETEGGKVGTGDVEDSTVETSKNLCSSNRNDWDTNLSRCANLGRHTNVESRLEEKWSLQKVPWVNFITGGEEGRGEREIVLYDEILFRVNSNRLT